MIEVRLCSVFVADQSAALAFYTEVLGFLKKHDIDMGGPRWLTVVAPSAPDGVELLLEPNVNPAAEAYQRAIFEQGIPATAFWVDDLDAEYGRLSAAGVVFRTGPTEAGPARIAVLEDGCGNLIQLYQV